MNKSIRNLVLAGVFVALGLLLPLLTGQIPQIGSMLLPMHIPVLLCGFLCGWPWGLAVGAVTPLLRSLLFGMPPFFPTAVIMAFELAAYGAFAGILMGLMRRRLGLGNGQKTTWRTYAGILCALVGAMLVGRVVWGVVSLIVYTLMGSTFTWQVFAAGAFVNAVPGIILQLVLIPPLVLAVWKVEARA